ncbi:MAG TPA: heavy-metal-associated domain-containing protein [Agromyces sp.]|nr:heavy-metal-associated domain-containing protein [Agromyces sp.]
MNTPVRLGLFAGALIAIFAAAFGAGKVLVPASAADAWHGDADNSAHGAGHEASDSDAVSVRGIAAVDRGYELHELDAPRVAGQSGELTFVLSSPDGAPLREYVTEHEKDLHLIVVRTDGSEFRHVHPTLAADGSWSLPWTWNAAGDYRVYADFVPGALGENLTLTTSFLVEGAVERSIAPSGDTAQAGPYEVTLDGDLTAASGSSLSFVVTQSGEPVTLEPYLGANGHLVALRHGDLAYLHVHPEHMDSSPGSAVSFIAQVPSPGTYLLYLDFKVAGQVHTAAFIQTAAAQGADPRGAGSHGDDDATH